MTQISSSQPDTRPEATADVTPSIEPEYDSLFYVDMEFQDANGGEWFKARALLDGGSQGSCINNKVSESCLVSHTPKPTPTSMIMADGNLSTTGPITHYDPIHLRISGNVEPYELDITLLSHTIILSAPWLRRHNPTFNFREGELTFLSDYCRHCCSHYGKMITLHWESKPVQCTTNLVTHLPEPEPEKSVREVVSESPTNTMHEAVELTEPEPEEGVREVVSEPPTNTTSGAGRSTKPKKQSVKAADEPTGSAESTKPGTRSVEPHPSQIREALRIAVISAAGFALACKQASTELFFLMMKKAEAEEAVAYNNVTVEDNIDLPSIPSEYHDFADLFSKKKADELPAHGPYDYKIPLVEGATPHWGPRQETPNATIRY